MKNTEITVAEYLLLRLKEIGVDHIFGVPGDFVLGFFNQVLKSDIKYIGTCMVSTLGVRWIVGSGSFKSGKALWPSGRRAFSI